MYNPPIPSRAQSVSSIRSAVKACTQLDILRQDVHEFALAFGSEGMSCQLLHGDVKTHSRRHLSPVAVKKPSSPHLALQQHVELNIHKGMHTSSRACVWHGV